MSNVHPNTIANLKPFVKGTSGNPGGKPKGSKNRLQGDFMRRLADDFERFGIYAIARVRRNDPAAYIRAIASLMPKELEISRPLDDLTDEQLNAALIAARALLAAQDFGAGAGDAAGAEQAAGLSPVREAG